MIFATNCWKVSLKFILQFSVSSGSFWRKHLFVNFVVYLFKTLIIFCPTLYEQFSAELKKKRHSPCLDDHFETKWIFEVFFFRFWGKKFRFVGHNFPIGLSKLPSTSPKEPSEEICLPEEVPSESIISLIWVKVCRIFENTSSGTEVKSAPHEFIGTFWEWIGWRLFKNPSDVWMNGFRNFVGRFPAVLSTLHSPCTWGGGTIERHVFFSKKFSLFLFEPWIPSTTTFVFLLERFYECLSKRLTTCPSETLEVKTLEFFLFFWYVICCENKQKRFGLQERKAGWYKLYFTKQDEPF